MKGVSRVQSTEYRVQGTEYRVFGVWDRRDDFWLVSSRPCGGGRECGCVHGAAHDRGMRSCVVAYGLSGILD